MGIFSNDEEPMWSDVFALQDNLKHLQEENEELKVKNKSIAKDYVGVFGDYQKYKQALEDIRTYINQECENKQCPQICANCFIGNILIKINEVLK